MDEGKVTWPPRRDWARGGSPVKVMAEKNPAQATLGSIENIAMGNLALEKCELNQGIYYTKLLDK